MATAEELRVKGNEYYREQNYTQAVQCYSDALNLTPHDPVILSNRSVSYLKLNQYDKALHDAEQCVSVKQDWAKGHFRKVAALLGLKEHKKAKEAAVLGFQLYDLKLCKEFISQWLTASKGQMDPDTSALLKKKPYFFFYPDGIDSFCDEYSQILLDIVMSQMPSQAQGVLGFTHVQVCHQNPLSTWDCPTCPMDVHGISIGHPTLTDQACPTVLSSLPVQWTSTGRPLDIPPSLTRLVPLSCPVHLSNGRPMDVHWTSRPH